MSLQAAFIFSAPEADANKHRATVRTPQVELTVVGVANYAEAERAAKALVDQLYSSNRAVRRFRRCRCCAYHSCR